MDFSIIDPHTNAVFQQILSRIRRLQSGGTIDSLQDIVDAQAGVFAGLGHLNENAK